MFLNDIVKDFVVENKEVECKAILSNDKELGWLKTVDGFLNAKGGIFYIGVEDKTFKLIGFDEKGLDKEKLYFYNRISNHFDLKVNVVSETIPYIVNDKKRYILKLTVLESKEKPVILYYDNLPLIFLRRDGYTSSVTREEIREMIMASPSISYDKELTDIKFNKDDFKTFYNEYKENLGKEIKEKELAAIGFFNEEGYLYRGSYLFSDKCNESVTKIVCNEFPSISKGEDRLLSSSSFTGNLLEGYKFIVSFLDKKMNHGYIKTNNKHINIDSYPERSITEATINALAHRNYFINGSEISVNIYKNRLVISSPGSLYEGKDVPITYELSKFISKRRNELISAIFVYLNLMESKGSGFEKIEKDYMDSDDKHKPFVYSKNNQFSICLPDITYENGVEIEEEALLILKGHYEDPKINKILSFCYSSKKGIKEITEFLNISNSMYFREKYISFLVKEGLLIEISDNEKTKLYLTNRDFVKLN